MQTSKEPTTLRHVADSLASPVLLTDEIPASSVLRYLGMLRRQRALLLWFILIGALSGVLLIILIPPKFDSTTRIVPDDQVKSSQGLLGMMGKVAGSGMTADMLGLKTSGALLSEILGSRTIQDSIIDQFNLLSVYKVHYRKDARKKLTKYTSIVEDRGSGVISITVRDKDRYRAAAIAREYVTQLNQISAQLDTSAARKEREFLEARLGQIKQDLSASEAELGSYSSTTGTIDLTEQAKAMLTGTATLEASLVSAQAQLSALEQVYGPENNRVLSEKAHVGELQRQLDQITAQSSSGAPAHVSGALPSIRDLPLRAQRYADLYRQVKTEETVFALLTQQYELAKVDEARDVPRVRVLDQADIAEKRSYPPRVVVFIICVLVSLALAVAWIVTCDDENPSAALFRRRASLATHEMLSILYLNRLARRHLEK